MPKKVEEGKNVSSDYNKKTKHEDKENTQHNVETELEQNMEQGDQTRNIFQEENTEKSVNNVAISKSVDEMNSDDKEEAKKLGAEITEDCSEKNKEIADHQATQQPSQSKSNGMVR